MLAAAAQTAYRGVMPAHLLAQVTPTSVLEAWRRNRSLEQPELRRWALFEGGRPRASCSTGHARDEGESQDSGEIYSLGVHPDDWRRGLGRRITLHATEDLFARGYTDVRLWCLTRNAAGREFYERLGFEVVTEETPRRFLGEPLLQTRYVLARPDTYLRPARSADAERLARVHQASWEAAYRGLMPDQLMDALSTEERSSLWRERLESAANPMETWVLESEGDVQGFCTIGPTRLETEDPRITSEIHALYVEPAVWSRGYGQRLTEFCLSQLFEQGCEDVRLFCLTTNPVGRRFYERSGFRVMVEEEPLEFRGYCLPHTRYVLRRPEL